MWHILGKGLTLRDKGAAILHKHLLKCLPKKLEIIRNRRGVEVQQRDIP